MQIDAAALAEKRITVDELFERAQDQVDQGAVMIYSSAPPDTVSAVQERLGREAAGQLIENTLGELAARLVASGVRKLIVAGGETAGAVVRFLKIDALRIGPAIEPGVPWTISIGNPELLLAFKSGNFGSREFFEIAMEKLP